MWATSAMGIQVCEQPGRCTNILNKARVHRDAGDEHRVRRAGSRGLVTQGGKIYREKREHGRPIAWELVETAANRFVISRVSCASHENTKTRKKKHS
jgi:hypothetical protein